MKNPLIEILWIITLYISTVTPSLLSLPSKLERKPPDIDVTTTPETNYRYQRNISTTQFTLNNLGLPQAPTTATEIEWKCPYIETIHDISCICDHPHTIRCRGQVTTPKVLPDLAKILTELNSTVSLLDLDFNDLNLIIPNSFKNLTLLGLVISTANLTTIPFDSFRGLENNLGALGLPSNELTVIPSDAIKSLKKLQKLNLRHNKITSLPAKAFPKMFMLQDLNLSYNNISTITPEAFTGLPQLKILDLSNNKLDIGQFTIKRLWGLKSLDVLYIRQNLLKGAILPDYIQGLPYLTYLDLSQNNLTSIKMNALKNCPQLKILDLSYNHIDVIEDHAFHSLPHLERLIIAHNRVVAISGYSFAHITNLKYLNLADNVLRAVTSDLLHQLPNLEKLNLAANDITLVQSHVFNFTRSLKHLSLADNPLQCDCQLEWLREWLINNKELSTAERNEIICATPFINENAPLVELNSTELKCGDNYGDYPDYYNDYYHEDISHAPLRISDADISMVSTKWKENGLELEWQIGEPSLPYKCGDVFIYQKIHVYPDHPLRRDTLYGSSQEIKSLKEYSQKMKTLHDYSQIDMVKINCSSETIPDPSILKIVIPSNNLQPGNTYMYCLVLLEKGINDTDSLNPGCSDPSLLSMPPKNHSKSTVNSLTAGSVDGSLVIHTRIDSQHVPCTYTVIIISERKVAASVILNCSEVRHEITLELEKEYTVCVLTNTTDVSKDPYKFDYNDEEQHRVLNNTVSLSSHFDLCASPVLLTNKYETDWRHSHWLILIFTLPGLGLIITLYVLGRKVWKGGGILWKWDPRSTKTAKYFLYISETDTPSTSLDPIPDEIPENTTRV